MTYKYKKILSAFTVAAGIFTITSCKKSFLEVNPQGQLTEDQVLIDPNAASNMVTGVYNTLYLGGFGPTTVGFEYVLATELASDDADKGSTPSDGQADFGSIDNFTMTANNPVVNNLWQGYYQGISKANRAIDQLNKATFDETTKTRLLGEVRFIRGMYYFNLVRLFGGVPKIIRVPEASEFNSDEFQTRATKEEIYTVITEDLQFASDNLSMTGETGSQAGRATKGAAQSLLSKVYLYQKDWQKAYDLSKAVIASGKYSLVKNNADTLTDFNLIFREKPENGVGGNNNTESIFEVQTGINVGENAVSPLFSNGQGPRSTGGWNDLGFGFNSPSQDLANAFEANDTRRAGTIIFINPTVPENSPGTFLWDGYRLPTQDSVANARYNYKAYHSPLKESVQVSNNKDTKPKNIRILRYAEVLLINAEAAAMLGIGSEALSNLTMVRARAGLTTSAAAVADIWKERRSELAMEQDRFFDLVRTGRAGVVLRAQGKAFVDGKNDIFPIPQPQIDLSAGRLTQNNGY